MTLWCDAETAVQVVESGNKVFLQGMCLTPTPLIEALVARGEELRNVELYTALTFGPAPYTDPRWVGHFHVNACFVATSERPAVNAGYASYIPIFLYSIAKLFMPAVPAADRQLLADRRDLGMHTEMFSDGVIDLVQRGVSTGARKALDRGKMVSCFVVASQRLMDFVDNNPAVKLYPVSYTNNRQIM